MSTRRVFLFLLAALLCALVPATAGATRSTARAHRSTRHPAHATRQRCTKRRRAKACRSARPTAAHHPALTGVATRPASAGSATPRRAHRAQPASGALTVSSAPSNVPAPVASTAPCANADMMPAAANLAVVETATLCLINQVRGQHGLPALAANDQLQSSAVRHDNDMVAQNYFAHNGPAGDTPESRITDSGYLADSGGGYAIGENIAWGTGTDATPQAIVTAWVNSPEHLANILDASYADSGLAVTPQAPASVSGGAAGAVYTQDFGGISAGGN
jgi:uncharacterized protein YkwD